MTDHPVWVVKDDQDLYVSHHPQAQWERRVPLHLEVMMMILHDGVVVV
jgi:hypothetical protein